jgi:hypothetical protein
MDAVTGLHHGNDAIPFQLDRTTEKDESFILHTVVMQAAFPTPV